MIFNYDIESRLSIVEEVEFVAVEDVAVKINQCQPISGVTLASVIILTSFRADIGQCGGIELNEYINEAEEVIFNDISFPGTLDSIKADVIKTTYTINRDTGNLNVTSDISFKF